ncbi:hypothetical protein [Bradyrhizobium jicamae]|uniref:hypothetical protein n=1 Tax=Bradyrhizobium jicamae TaxID=280332 RepID=UPI001BAB625B|nr:hypothetical protein [Bradyrhizobium jicamae]MBR0938511.1 hypothetical protein [Bradyrhizobium jicamae]
MIFAIRSNMQPLDFVWIHDPIRPVGRSPPRAGASKQTQELSRFNLSDPDVLGFHAIAQGSAVQISVEILEEEVVAPSTAQITTIGSKRRPHLRAVPELRHGRQGLGLETSSTAWAGLSLSRLHPPSRPSLCSQGQSAQSDLIARRANKIPENVKKRPEDGRALPSYLQSSSYNVTSKR